MFVNWPRALASGLFVLTLVGLASHASACAVARGDRVLLASQGLDPDVFVWDSAGRLLDYAQGNFDTQIVLRHTLLAKPGTGAVATDCRDAAVHTQFSKSDLDLVGVKLITGPNRGHYGWVTAEDVRRPNGKPVVLSTP